jgi:hypothetical protein
VDLRRLRAGEWLAAVGGLALIVSLLLPWYGAGLPIVREDSRTGFEALSVIDAALVLLALPGVALAGLQATQDGPAKPVAAAVLCVPAGALATLLVAFRLIDVPGDGLEVREGAWLALAATIAITAGGWLSLAAEYVRGLPPGPEPELRPSPRIADRAQP